MVCHARRTSASPRRHHQLSIKSPPSSRLAVLDLTKPDERDAHEFVVRSTNKNDPMWKLLDLRRQEGSLLCVVRWIRSDNTPLPFSLVEVSLTEKAVCWRDYANCHEARAELFRRCIETSQQD